MSERIHFVVDALSGDETVKDVCQRYGISRKTGYKWLGRYREVGSLSALAEQSRRPHHSPRRTATEIEDRIVELRHEHGWGPRKLHRLLKGEGIRIARPTIARILKRRGLIIPDGRSRPAVTRFERASPNELVQMDFKSPYELTKGSICLPLSLLDDHRRYALALAPLPSTETDGVLHVLEGVMERYGVPESILVDHGTPWWSSTNGHGLTRLGVFLIRQGVQLVYSGVGHPQTQGKVERFHKTLKAWLRHHGRPTTLAGLTHALDAFRHEYNEVRPHEALEMDTPSHRYHPSPRLYQSNPEPWEYPTGAEVKRLTDNG